MKKSHISVVLSSLVATMFIGCGNNSSTESKPTPTPQKVTNLEVPVSEADKKIIKSVESIEINNKSYDVSFNTILRTGTTLNGETFGLLKDINQNPIKSEDGSSFICRNSVNGSGPDHTSLLQKDGKLFMVTQFECEIGAMYMAELEQDSNGKLSAKSLKFIDQSSDFGGFVHCAGMKTPWESHLSSEEYEPDANSLDENGEISDSYYNFTKEYFSGNMADTNPYYYGWTPEVKILNANGDYEYTKHYSMGRFSHELAYVMPDNKTVYLSDDGTNVGLYMYIADNEKDLSAGTLYAVKWNQTSSENGGSANLEWINLGHATDSEIKNFVVTKPKFSDIFNEATPNEDGTCPSGFTSINTGHVSGNHECLSVKAGMDKIASRLETRRYSAIKGATTEFRKEEGITFDADRNRLYVAMSRVQYGMEDNKKQGADNNKYDFGGNNDIKLPHNKCGSVFALDVVNGVNDKSGNAINSNLVAKNMYAIISGEEKSYEGELANNSCNVDKIAEPDNITYLTGSDILVIGEDGGYHENNYIWTYNLKTSELNRVLSAPLGSETTSPFWYPNINGFGYLTTVIQHPFGELNDDDVLLNKKAESYIGYVGAFKGGLE